MCWPNLSCRLKATFQTPQMVSFVLNGLRVFLKLYIHVATPYSVRLSSSFFHSSVNPPLHTQDEVRQIRQGKGTCTCILAACVERHVSEPSKIVQKTFSLKWKVFLSKCGCLYSFKFCCVLNCAHWLVVHFPSLRAKRGEEGQRNRIKFLWLLNLMTKVK